MTASSRVRVFILASCLVIVAAMPPAAQPAAPGHTAASGLKTWSPRRIVESSLGLEIVVVGRAVPTTAEQKDGYIAVEDVVPGDVTGEWVATTPHGAHWFDAQWRQVGVTDLGRRYRRVHPVRFERSGPVALVAEEGNVDRLIEFDRDGRETRRIDLLMAHPPVFGDLDGDGVLEIALASKKEVQVRRRDGSLVRTLPFDGFVTDLDLITVPPTGTVGLLAYQFLSPSRGTRLQVVSGTGERLHEWVEHDAAPYSVVDGGASPILVAQTHRVLRLRELSGRPIATRDSGYDVRTLYARGVRRGSGHEVFLLYNRHYGTSALVIYDGPGRRVHVEHPGGFSSTLWTLPDEPEAFYMAVGPDIVRYRIRP